MPAHDTEHAMTDWFDEPNPAGVADAQERGLRFSCTMCGNCCTGPAGYVLVRIHNLAPRQLHEVVIQCGVTDRIRGGREHKAG